MAMKLGSTSRYWGGLFVVIALFGFQWMSVEGGSAWLCIVYALITAVIAAAACRWGDRARALLWRLGPPLPRLPAGVWIIAIILLGMALRVWVALAFPAELRSDPAAYAHLAQELVDGRPYSAPEGRAFWPPGLPLALAPLLILFGKHAILIYNLLAFVAAEIAIFGFGRKLAGPTTALVGMFFVAVWPSFLFLTPLLTKEPLLIALWPAIAWLYLDATETRSDRRAFIFAFAAGVAVGYSALVQPSGILLSVLLTMFSYFALGLRRRALTCLAAAAIGVAATTSPWVIRNYEVFHKFVPIDTGGGVNFYMVQRPDSDGRWFPGGAEAAMKLSADELVRNDRGYALGWQAIVRDPTHMIVTFFKRPFYLFGHSIRPIYSNFEYSGDVNSWRYFMTVAFAHLFYAGILLLVTLQFFSRDYRPGCPAATVLALMFIFYPMFAHCLFEASERHAYGTMGFVALFAASSLRRPEAVGVSPQTLSSPIARAARA